VRRWHAGWHRARTRTSPLASLRFGFAPGFRQGRESPGDGGFVHVAESDTRPGLERTVLSRSSSRAWRTPGSGLLVKAVGAGDPTLSPGACCRSLMTDFQQCGLAPARILSPAAGHEAEEKLFPLFHLHLSEGCSAATALLTSGQDGSRLGWSRQTRASSRPTARLETRSESSCSASCGFGISPRRAHTAQGWWQQGFHPGFGEEEEEGGRCRRWGTGVTAKCKELTWSSGCHLRSPAPSQAKTTPVQGGERLPGAGGHPGPRRERGHRGGEAAWLRGRWPLGFFASVAWPSFESWNVLKDELSELLFLVLFCFK